MANVSSNMLITDETLSQISLELLGREDVSFTFPYLMIGDATYPLENNSGPILNHIYMFPVTEIARSGNNILLTATIDEDAYLTIKELALYCRYGNGTTHVFSKITGLNVKKGKDLAYNLMIQVKLDLNVVNTIAMPEIVLKEVTYPKMSDFKTVKDVYAYTVENLERMIKTNALGIGSYSSQIMTDKKPVGVGYNTAQVYCAFQDKLNSWEDNFCATFAYASLQSLYKETEHTGYLFDGSSLELFGGAYIAPNGEGSVRSAGSTYVNMLTETMVATSQDLYVNTETEVFSSVGNNFYVDEPSEALVNTQMDRIEVKTFEPFAFICRFLPRRPFWAQRER